MIPLVRFECGCIGFSHPISFTMANGKKEDRWYIIYDDRDGTIGGCWRAHHGDKSYEQLSDDDVVLYLTELATLASKGHDMNDLKQILNRQYK